MPTIITRNSKGSLLTPTEGDDQIAFTTRHISGLLTLSALHNRETLECDGTFAVTLPDAATLQGALDESASFGDIGFTAVIANAGAGTITVDLTTAADTLAGVANGTLTLEAGESYTIVLNTNGGTADGYFITAWALPEVSQTVFAAGASGNVNSTSGTVYMSPTGKSNFGTSEANQSMLCPSAGTLKRLYCRAVVSNSLDGTIVVTLMINGVATALTATITAGSTALFSDLSNTVAIAAGDTLSYRLVESATTGAAQNVVVSAVLTH